MGIRGRATGMVGATKKSIADRDVRRSPFRRALGTALAGCALWSAASAFQEDSGAAPEKPSYYVRAGRGGAPVYNIPDTKGHALRRAPEGSLLAVYAERSGFLEIESPGGLPVWVFGQYLTPTGTAGLYEVTGDRVLMRPRPTSKQSFPLSKKLFRGNRVRVVDRANPDKPFHEDWIRIWSAPGTRAWALASAVTPVPQGTDVTADWARDAQALRREFAPQPSEASATKSPLKAAAMPGSKPGGGAGAVSANSGSGSNADAQKAFMEAEARFAELGEGNMNLAELRQAYQRVIDLAPQSSWADEARMRLREIAVREEIAALRDDVAADGARRDAAAARQRRDLERMDAKNEPLWGRFQSRGWLERQERAGEAPFYTIRWAGDVKTEVLCTSGRYDLSVFEGFEVGLNGLDLGASKYAGGGSGTAARRLDVSRIEVISGRYRN